MLEKIAQYVPPSIKANKIFRGFLWPFLNCISYGDKMYLNYNYRLHSSKLKKFTGIHKGQRCFIIGTGPSLNQTNLSLLKDELIFGVNTLYTGLDKFGITCAYYAVSDGIIWRNHYKEILGIDTALFLGGEAGKEYLSDLKLFRKFQKTKPLVVRQLGYIEDSSCFSRDISKGHYEHTTVIIDMCLQVAYYLGFKEVYLLGCDCDYSGLHRFDGSTTDNPHGREWDDVFVAYEMCKKFYEEDGREIINATVGGKLEVFKRKKLEELI
ncbi:6-hydroxymethylpterin diphosphokinase MptE-like protein [Chloroflexota bacterium]